MDWNNIKNGLVEKSKLALDKTKEYTDKWLKATQEKIDEAIKIKNLEELESLKQKKLYLVVWEKNNKDYTNLLIKFPAIKTKAWIDWVVVKTIELNDFPELKEKLAISTIPAIIFYEENEIKKIYTDSKEINSYFLKWIFIWQ